MASTLEVKIAMGIATFKAQRVPENSCIALEIEKIGKKLRVAKAQRSYFRVAVYWGWRKIQNPTDDLRKFLETMDVPKSGSLPSETGSSEQSEPSDNSNM